MKIFVRVKTGAKIEKVERINKTHFSVSVKARPIKGQANKKVIYLISTYLKIPRSNIEISSGLTSPNKTLKIF